MKKKLVFITFFFIFLMSWEYTAFPQPGDAPRMTKQVLRAAMGNPDVVIIDVRQHGDWTDSDSKIKGAVREDPGAIESWANKYPKDKTLVFYCA